MAGTHGVPAGSVKAQVKKRMGGWHLEYIDGQGRVIQAYDFGGNYPSAKAAKNRAEVVIRQRARGIDSPLSPALSPQGAREQAFRQVREVWGLDEEKAQAVEAVMEARAARWGADVGRPAVEWYGEHLYGQVRGMGEVPGFRVGE